VSPLAALAALCADVSRACGDRSRGGGGRLNTASPLEEPPGWEIVRTQKIDQMVYVGPSFGERDSDDSERSRRTGHAFLIEDDQAGPFLQGTIAMGSTWAFARRRPSCRDGGQRLQLHSAVEISAVCKEPAIAGAVRAVAGVVLTALSWQHRRPRQCMRVARQAGFGRDDSA